MRIKTVGELQDLLASLPRETEVYLNEDMMLRPFSLHFDCGDVYGVGGDFQFDHKVAWVG
jgi:hypothetical protein